MNVKICPFVGKACEYHGCALYVKTDDGGGCAVAVIATEMQAGVVATDRIADNVNAVDETLGAVNGAVKGLV